MFVIIFKLIIAYFKLIAIKNGDVFMGYLFIALTLTVGGIKGYCGKMTSGYIKRHSDAMLMTFVRMLLCAVFGGIVIVFSGQGSLTSFGGRELLISLLSGAANALFVVAWLISVRKGAYMMVDIFCTLGTLAAIALSAIFFGEKVSLRQIIGLAGLVISVVIMCSYNNGIKAKITVTALLLLILCGISSGLADFSQKMFVKSCSGSSVAVFNFYTYIFAAAVLLAAYLISLKSHEDTLSAETQIKLFKKIAVYLAVMAISLYLHTYFKTKAAAVFPASRLYSILLGGQLAVSTGISAIIFGERVTLKSVFGISVAFLSLLLINL